MAWSRAAASRIVSLALAVTAAASIASMFAAVGWPFELFSHFRWQLAAASVALLLAALAVRRPALALVAFATLGLQWMPVALLAERATAGDSNVATCGKDELRLVTANALFASRSHSELIDWLVHSNADLIALQEITPALSAELAPMAGKYPYRTILPRDDPYGIAVLSRWPLVDSRTMDFAGDGLPSLVATAEVRGHRVRVIALHTRVPLSPSMLATRDRALRRAGALAATNADSTVMLGDFNLTPYAPAFARLLAQSGLRDSLEDATWRPTWQAGFWPLALPLDHVLVPRGSCITAHEIGPYVGSDHRPLQVTLRLP